MLIVNRVFRILCTNSNDCVLIAVRILFATYLLMYTRESDLVRDFVSLLRSNFTPWPDLDVAFEFDYQAGRVDVIGANIFRDLFSFEAKLTRWREALHQAYRNTSFSHHSYVVLPESTAQKAIAYCHEFEIREVGLCSVGHSGIVLEIPSSRQHPILTWLTGNALEYIIQVNKTKLASEAHDTEPAFNAADCRGVQQVQ